MNKRSLSTRISTYTVGLRDGKSWRRRRTTGSRTEAARRAVQEEWSRKARRIVGRKPAWNILLRQGRRYAAGFRKGSGKEIKLTPIPLRGKAAAVLYAPRRIKSLLRVLRQLRKLPLKDTVIVMHDATPEYFAAARSEPGVLIVHLPDLPDPDAGRALGAKLTGADIVLFVDAERPVQAKKLARFLWAVDGRLDAALNDVTAQLGLFHLRHHKFRLAEFLNTSLNRPDLVANTLSVLPYALSRRALNTLGASVLAVPAKAHAAALLLGLKVGTGTSVGIDTTAKIAEEDAVWNKTAGDHAEAWREALLAKGNRIVFPDRVRNRMVLEEWAR